MHIEKQHAKFADTDTDTYVQTVSHFLIKRLEIKKNVVWCTVEPCTLAQSDHLWDLAVTKPMILSTKGINMTWCGYIGLQHIQKSAF